MVENQSEKIQDNNTQDGLKFVLGEFNGPLDLLLHLIRDSKIDIETVFLSSVTEQFLSYMEEVDSLSLELAGEFLSVASTLLEIKSKALLPRYDIQDIEEVDEAQMLLQRLEEYRLIKEASKSLKEIEDVGKFYRQPDKMTKDIKVNFKEEDVNVLYNAFSKILLMNEEEFERRDLVNQIIPKDSITVEEQSFEIVHRLKTQGKVWLFGMFERKPTKIQLVITFLAMLELIKNGEITVKQDNMFGDVLIELAENEQDK